MTNKKIILNAYNSMPLGFYGIKLINKVTAKIGKPYRYGDTVLRVLRQLRNEGIINYICLNKQDSFYKKIK
jgi:hypothetical protein